MNYENFIYISDVNYDKDSMIFCVKYIYRSNKKIIIGIDASNTNNVFRCKNISQRKLVSCKVSAKSGILRRPRLIFPVR